MTVPAGATSRSREWKLSPGLGAQHLHAVAPAEHPSLASGCRDPSPKIPSTGFSLVQDGCLSCRKGAISELNVKEKEMPATPEADKVKHLSAMMEDLSQVPRRPSLCPGPADQVGAPAAQPKYMQNTAGISFVS